MGTQITRVPTKSGARRHAKSEMKQQAVAKHTSTEHANPKFRRKSPHDRVSLHTTAPRLAMCSSKPAKHKPNARTTHQECAAAVAARPLGRCEEPRARSAGKLLSPA